MTHGEALALLPCYVAGDLPADVAAAVAQAVSTDPDLREIATALRAEHQDAVRALCGGAVPPEVIARLATRPPARTVPAWLLLSGLAVAAAFVLLVLPGPSGRALATFSSGHAAALVAPGALDPAEGEAIARTFDAASVPAPLRAVGDWSRAGLRATRVVVLAGDPPGTATVYVADGRVYVCQMWVGLAPPPRAAKTVRIGEAEVRGYRRGDVSFVVWEEGGMICVLSAATGIDELLALLRTKLAATG